ncbi:MAG: hypothetical protein CL466_08920 [Acidimicrobiaceae bacterium]|nr:hypothetical protein [Acidimicrobiaceae bacterium]
MGTITHLPGIAGADEGTRGTVVNHRMRQITELVAADGTWDEGLVGEVRGLFDSLAPDWTATRDHPTRNAPVLDALDRGGVERGALAGWTVLELGAGTCISARDLVGRFDTFVAADLSWGMLSHAVDGSPPLVCTDGSSLPLADGVLDVLVLQNMFLFAAEVDRCLALDGALVWVNSRGPETPIHLSTGAVVDALEVATDTDWDAVDSTVGEATWAVVRRA